MIFLFYTKVQVYIKYYNYQTIWTTLKKLQITKIWSDWIHKYFTNGIDAVLYIILYVVCRIFLVITIYHEQLGLSISSRTPKIWVPIHAAITRVLQWTASPLISIYWKLTYWTFSWIHPTGSFGRTSHWIVLIVERIRQRRGWTNWNTIASSHSG